MFGSSRQCYSRPVLLTFDDIKSLKAYQTRRIASEYAFERIAGGQATWPAEVPAHLGLVATVNRLCEELEALVPKPATKKSISASPGAYLPALKHILKSYEAEHRVAGDAKRPASLTLPRLFPLTPQPSLQWRHISLNAEILASLIQQDPPSAPQDYNRVFESVFDLSRFR